MILFQIPPNAFPKLLRSCRFRKARTTSNTFIFLATIALLGVAVNAHGTSITVSKTITWTFAGGVDPTSLGQLRWNLTNTTRDEWH